MDAASGGFTKVRERLGTLLSKSDEDEEVDVDVDVAVAVDVDVLEGQVRGDLPSTLSRSDWEAIAKGFKTQRAAREHTGYDAKTISKYFEQHNIANPWKKSRGV